MAEYTCKICGGTFPVGTIHVTATNGCVKVLLEKLSLAQIQVIELGEALEHYKQIDQTQKRGISHLSSEIAALRSELEHYRQFAQTHTGPISELKYTYSQSSTTGK